MNWDYQKKKLLLIKYLLLEDFSFEGQTVMMAPASGFYATKGLGKQEVRLAYVLNKDALKNAIKCLEEALKVYPGRTK